MFYSQPKLLTILLLCLISTAVLGQNFPASMQIMPESHRLVTDYQQSSGIYDLEVIRNIYLQFDQPDYWQQLLDNKDAGIDIPATMTVDGKNYPGVGVRFKGQTSYWGVPNSMKKSFNITIDYSDPDQNWEGHETINLNNAYQDASFMREVLYLHQIRKHIPAAKACYVRLYINGQDWGLYPHVQQLDGTYIKEWFFSNDGTRWRADRPDGTLPGGPGGMWGDGTAALNYLGTDTALYQKYYTLKRTEKENPWSDLIQVCDALNNTPLNQLIHVMPDYLDLDRTLWFLASEILFSDDDGYVYKGKMDYYLYWDPETGRITPLEYDGNSVMKNNTVNWSPFYNANKVNYPLLNRLLAVPEIRQRYLAHFRTLMEDIFSVTEMNARINTIQGLISSHVQSDPKKLYPTSAFNPEINVLKNFVSNRTTFLNSNAEIQERAPDISAVTMSSVNGIWTDPEAEEEVTVTAYVTSTEGISRVRIFWSDALTGQFTPVTMYDDGLHGDGIAGDGVYGGSLPPFKSESWVRFYIEAASDNSAKSIRFEPRGAEHDVYYFRVLPKIAEQTDIVINEIMADNASTIQDPAGEYDDWIELFNKGTEDVALDGWFLSDKVDNKTKWRFSDSIVIPAGGYLIVWADENGSQGPLHANFKLSKSGEAVYLSAPDTSLVDQVEFDLQETDRGYARIPNGTGDFVIQAPTFAANNEGPSSIPLLPDTQLMIYPNPSHQGFHITSSSPSSLNVTTATGKSIWYAQMVHQTWIDATGWPAGIYFLHTDTGIIEKLIKY